MRDPDAVRPEPGAEPSEPDTERSDPDPARWNPPAPSDPRPATGPAASLLGEGRRRYEAGDFADAEPLARRALELRPADGPAEPRAEALQLVAEIAFSRGRYPEAMALADEARELRRGATPESIAETDNLLGIIALAQGDVAAAKPLIEAGLTMRTEAL